MDERPVRLEVNGWTLASWTASPDHADALGAGRLLADGFIDSRTDVLSLEVEETPTATIVRARVDPARVAAVRASGAPDILARLAGNPPARRPRAPLPPLDAFGPLFRQLFRADDLTQDASGLHAAALSDGRTLRHRLEEVGRHNAVDKAIGLALLAGDDLARLGLLITARISGEMALKAARAGLAWVASRSVPTTLAVAVAESARLPIIARAAGREPHVYAAPAAPPRFYPGSPLAGPEDRPEQGGAP